MWCQVACPLRLALWDTNVSFQCPAGTEALSAYGGPQLSRLNVLLLCRPPLQATHATEPLAISSNPAVSHLLNTNKLGVLL